MPISRDIRVAAAPSAGRGLALDERAKVPPAALPIKKVTLNVNPPSINAATVTAFTADFPAGTCDVGDLILLMGVAGHGNPVAWECNPVCSTTDQVTMRGVNGSAAAQDEAARDFTFLILRL